jgi:Xaa-Pro aminopeptidase
MAWLEQALVKEQRKVGEWAAAQTLTRFRGEEEHFV